MNIMISGRPRHARWGRGNYMYVHTSCAIQSCAQTRMEHNASSSAKGPSYMRTQSSPGGPQPLLPVSLSSGRAGSAGRAAWGRRARAVRRPDTLRGRVGARATSAHMLVPAKAESAPGSTGLIKQAAYLISGHRMSRCHGSGTCDRAALTQTA